MRPRFPRSTAVVVAGAALLLAIGSTGGAVAGRLITGKQIKNNTITSADIKNKTITKRDLAKSAQPKVGARGPAGATGPAGPAGATGPQGPRGFAAWDVIPSGTSVVGSLDILADDGGRFDGEGPTRLDAYFEELPAQAPRALALEDVRFGEHAGAAPAAVDPACSGSVAKPSAPAGKVCVYLDTVHGAKNVEGSVGRLADRTFAIAWTANPNASGYSAINGSWAYTAP